MADFGPAWLAEGAPAVKVFVAFKKEEYQRKVLEKLSTGHLPAFFERTHEGANVLKVEEVPEPTDVDFLHLGVPFVRQAMEQSTTLVGVVLMLTLLPARLRAARVAGCDRACPRPRARPRAADARALPVPACCPRPCAARARDLPAPASCPRPRPAPTPSLLLPLRCSCSFGCSYPFGVLFLSAPTPSVRVLLPVFVPVRCPVP